VTSLSLPQSFDFGILHRMQRLAPGIDRAALWEGEPRSLAQIASDAGTGIVAPEYHLVNEEDVREAHRQGLKVIPWTVNQEKDWKLMIEAGVDGMITDDPERLIRYLRG
jgi:glycerophosphoryl diester phosphodiesterase